MSERYVPPSERDEARYARIRQLREQREAPVRRRHRFQPIVLIIWFAGVVALLGIAIWAGFLAFAPRLMSWIEENPGTLDHGIIVDFVEWYEPEALADVPLTASDGRVTIEVPPGANDTEIGRQLAEAGLVNELAFQYAVIQAGREGTLQAGLYDLSPDMRPSQIVAALRQEPGEEVEVTIREGWRLEEITAYLATTDLTMNVDQFAQLVKAPPVELLGQYELFNDLRAGRTLEGYLYPDTYRIDANATAREVLEVLLVTFDERLTAELREQIAGQGLSIDEAVNIASIVEREAVVEEERPLIAGVYLNRLRNDGWRLDADPTLQYGLATSQHAAAPVSQWGEIDWWPALEVGGADLELPEELACYQTYRTDLNASLSDKLPCSPISAPRVSSIAAVAAPNVESGYFFFVAACPNGVRDGSHRFAVGLPEHEVNIAQAAAECPAG